MNKFKVTIQRKDQTVAKEVQKDSITIGRSTDCDIHLNDTLISRVHVVLTRRWNQIWLEDKNSSNGTFVNGTKIVQGTPVNIVPADRIQLGRSEYVILVDLQSEEIPPELPEVPSEPEEEEIAKTIAMPPPKDLTFHQEKIVHEAKKKAAQIIMEGEVQAEKRVQVIYQKARDAQEKAESFYQTRMTEAHKEADAILADYQRQGRELLADARSMSQEIREEVDTYVQSLRQRAKQDFEDKVSEATLAAEKIKSEAIEAARAVTAKESEEVLRLAREEADRLVDFAKLKAYEVQTAMKEDQETHNRLEEKLKMLTEAVDYNDNRLTELKAAADEMALRNKAEEESFLDTRTREETEFRERRSREEEEFRERRAREENEFRERRQREEESWNTQKTTEAEAWAAKKSAEEEAWNTKKSTESEIYNTARAKAEEELKALIERSEAFNKESQDTEKRLTLEKTNLEKSLAALKEKQALLLAEIGDIEGKKNHLYKEYESQKVILVEKIEKDKSQLAKTEEQRLEEMRMQNSQRIQKMEREMLDEILRRKDSMVREIFTNIEREVVKQLEPSRWREISANVESHIKESIEGKVSSMAQSSLTTEKPIDLIKKRKAEKWRMIASGAAAGMALLFGGQMAYEQIQRNQNPMQSMVDKEARTRKQDLERRKFNPPQVDELKDTYVDGVIYTRNFVEIYTDNDFQQKLYKASAQYMLKTWRIDEEKTLQVISAATALIKELQDKKSKIHPDFVKEGIEKMRDLEKDHRNRMKVVLGSEVRLDSFRRFEKNFYTEEVQRRQMAQH